MRLLTYALGMLVVGLGTLMGSSVFAGVTGSVGVAPSPLASQFDLSCNQSTNSDARVTGVDITISTSIWQVRLKCRRPTATGTWMTNSTTNTNWSGRSNLQFNPAPTTQSVECPADKFVAGFNAYTVGSFPNRTIRRIRIVCAQTTYFGQAFPSTFEAREVGAQATGGSWSQTNLVCPIASSANGATGKYFTSLRVLGFKCVDPARATFSALVPTFKHPRCVTCHSQQDASGKPLNHPQVNATSCTACHTDNLLPPGSNNPDWHMPPDSMRFDNKTNAQICQLALNHPDGFNHLREDRLVLWAVGGGHVPETDPNTPVISKQLPTAPPFDIQTWKNGVTAWQNDVNHPTSPSLSNPDPCGAASVQ